VESSPILGRDTVYFGSMDRNLYAVDLSGNLRWQLTLDVISDSPVLGSDQSVYLDSVSSQKLYAVDASHSNSWSFPFPGFIEFSSPALDTHGVIYFGGGGKVYAVRGSAGLADSSWPMHRRNSGHSGRADQRRMGCPKIRWDGVLAVNVVVEPAESYDVE